MTSDSFNITIFLWGLNESWINVAYISLIIVLLYYQLGHLIVSGLYMFVVAMSTSGIIALFMLGYSNSIMRFKDKRISLTTDVILGIKSL